MLSKTNIGKIGFLLVFMLATTVSFSQTKGKTKTVKSRVVEASCGQCQFGMKDKKGCDLAVRFDGKSYFVDGSKIDQHGDAHAKDGFCNAIRTAKVTGKVVDNKFVAKSFELLPNASK